MPRFNFQKQNKYHSLLAQIYNSASDELKSSVTLDDFINSFLIIEVDGIAREPEKPEDYKFDDIYGKVLEAFREVYNF